MSDPSEQPTVRVPAHLSVFVEVLGLEGAIEFLLEFGGARIYIAQRKTGNSLLKKSLGADKTHALWLQRDRIPARIPVGRVWIAQVWLARGMTVAEVARKLHVTDVTVRKYKAQMQTLTSTSDLQEPASKPGEQFDLFGGEL